MSGGRGSLLAAVFALSMRRARAEGSLDGGLLERRRRLDDGLRVGLGVLDEDLGSLAAWGFCWNLKRAKEEGREKGG